MRGIFEQDGLLDQNASTRVQPACDASIQRDDGPNSPLTLADRPASLGHIGRRKTDLGESVYNLSSGIDAH
jgi:hypothetical protein